MRASPQSVRYRKLLTGWLSTWPQRSGTSWNSATGFDEGARADHRRPWRREHRRIDGDADRGDDADGREMGERDNVAPGLLQDDWRC